MSWNELELKLSSVILAAFAEVPETFIPMIATNIALMEASDVKGPAKRAVVIAAVVSQSNEPVNEKCLGLAIDASVAACNAVFKILEVSCREEERAVDFAKRVDPKIEDARKVEAAKPKEPFVKSTPVTFPPAQPENRADLYKQNERHPDTHPKPGVTGPVDVTKHK